jgi:hypothetical protein
MDGHRGRFVAMIRQISIRKRFVGLSKGWGLALIAIGCVGIQPCRADDSSQNLQSVRAQQQLQSSIQRIQAQHGALTQQLTDLQRRALANQQYQQTQFQALHDRNQQTLTQMRQAVTPYVDPDGHTRYAPTYSADYITNTSRRMDLQEQQYANEANLQANLANDAQHRSNILDTESHNLESQLNSDQSNHGFKLSPVGTNLYVRNYQLGGSGGDDQDDDSSAHTPAGSLGSPTALPAQRTPGGLRSAPAPLAAQPGRLSNVNQKPTTGITNRSVAGKSGKVVQTTVTGQYLKP